MRQRYDNAGSLAGLSYPDASQALIATNGAGLSQTVTVTIPQNMTPPVSIPSVRGRSCKISSLSLITEQRTASVPFDVIKVKAYCSLTMLQNLPAPVSSRVQAIFKPYPGEMLHSHQCTEHEPACAPLQSAVSARAHIQVLITASVLWRGCMTCRLHLCCAATCFAGTIRGSSKTCMTPWKLRRHPALSLSSGSPHCVP